MNPLHLSGYGVKIRLKNLRSRSELVATDGRESLRQEPSTYSFRPRSVNEVRVVEGRLAQRYWLAFQSVIPETFQFKERITRSHQNNATDPVNLALNYAYGVLEGEVRWAINSVGLEPSAGFLHDFASYQTKESLVYDLQEPFRWLCDVTVLKAVESRTLDLKDFYFTGDDYRYRIEVNAKRRFLGLLQKSF